MKKPSFHKSFLFTLQGLIWISKHERNFQLELLAFLINFALIVYFPLNHLEIILIIGVCFLVLICECINTCIEKLCDYLEPNWVKEIGVIKDIAGGAVLLSVILALVTGILIYPQYILH